MIISNIIGGLGNQMFQYAAAKALSLRLDAPLKFDNRDFAGYKLHQGFELNGLFNCNVEVATNNDLNMVLSWQKNRVVKRLLKRAEFTSFRRKSYVVEPQFNYWSGIRQLKDNIYLDGYWQSEQYFIDFADTIHADFTFRPILSAQNAEIAKHIAQVNAVSLHVRRGDYAVNPKTTATHGLCSLDYYRAAIDYVSGHVVQPHFFIFSDDIAWVKANLNIDSSAFFVDHNANQESYNDMRLMSLCKHHIIANSSFSWWGAWLNQNAEKIVIAPKQWFSKSTDSTDLIPAGWIRL